MAADWVTGALLASSVQSLIVAVAVLAVRSGQIADKRLAALLMVLALKASPYVFGWRQHGEPPDWLALFPLNAPLAIGPLLYSYLMARTEGRPAHAEWLQLAPAGVECLYCCVCLLLPAELRHQWKETGHDHFVKPAVELAFVLSLTAYTLLSWWLSLRLRARAQAERSDADRIGSILSPVTVVLLLVTALAYAFIFIWSNFIAEIDIAPYFLWFAFVSVVLTLEGWRATAIPVLPSSVVTPTLNDRKQRDWTAIGGRWRERIEMEAWWREPDLALAEVARRLGVNTTYLSRAINDGLGRNFNELINGMRAREVARRLDAAEPDDLLEMAFDAGFTSKATFNRAFRASLGTAPSAYRKRIKS